MADLNSQTTEKDPITEGQQKQLKRFFENLGNFLFNEVMKKNPTCTSTQRLLGKGNELMSGALELTIELTRTDKYAEEEVESNYTYPGEYSLLPLLEQIALIEKEFGLSPDKAITYANEITPTLDLSGGEGWFAIPNYKAVAAKFFPETTDPNEMYAQAVNLVLEKIGKSRSFTNHRKGQITGARLRTVSETLAKMAEIEEAQGAADILIISCQLGQKHKGCSPRRARERMDANEFGLGWFAMGSIALTHPGRFVRFDELDVDCPGDEFDPVGNGDFSGSPYFRFNGGLESGAGDLSRASDGFGSASEFLPAAKN